MFDDYTIFRQRVLPWDRAIIAIIGLERMHGVQASIEFPRCRAWVCMQSMPSPSLLILVHSR